jgi:hypothetical protein
MKYLKILYIFIAITIFIGCSTNLQQTNINDDLYYVPKKQIDREITKELNKDIENIIVKKDSIKQLDSVYNYKQTNPYENILVDNYYDAHNRRIEAMKDISYGFNNYYDVQFSDAYWYASTYDPIMYNVIIMGDDVWVEPNWLSNSFRYGYHYQYNHMFYNNRYTFLDYSFFPYKYEFRRNYNYYPINHNYNRNIERNNNIRRRDNSINVERYYKKYDKRKRVNSEIFIRGHRDDIEKYNKRYNSRPKRKSNRRKILREKRSKNYIDNNNSNSFNSNRIRHYNNSNHNSSNRKRNISTSNKSTNNRSSSNSSSGRKRR